MVVAKFGGTSMKDCDAIKRSIEISRLHNARMVVVSATSGTTNNLLHIATLANSGNWDEADHLIEEIKIKHNQIAMDFSVTDCAPLEALYDELATLAKGICLLGDTPAKTLDRLQSIGERMSSFLMVSGWSYLYPSEPIELLDARKVLKTNDAFGKAIPNLPLIKENLSKLNKNKIYITQGFIGSTDEGKTTTLGRGGSDYSAALMAEGLNASALQIWTDVAGIATTDPRICPQALPIKEITFQEASELAIFGAKILHPSTLQPVIRQGISVFVGSSYTPESEGTWIRSSSSEQPLIRAMALRKGQILLTISIPKMLNAHGFLAKIFDIYNRFEVSVDAITTSEISVAMTIDQSVLSNQQFLDELKTLGSIKIEEKLALVSLIGNNINHTPGLAMSIFSGLHDDEFPINVRMICLGASRHNFCMVIAEDQAAEAISRLHRKFIEQ